MVYYTKAFYQLKTTTPAVHEIANRKRLGDTKYLIRFSRGRFMRNKSAMRIYCNIKKKRSNVGAPLKSLGSDNIQKRKCTDEELLWNYSLFQSCLQSVGQHRHT